MAGLHEPVLVPEVLAELVHRVDGIYLDGTVGTGGHAEAILGALSARGQLICLDQDPDALEVAKARLGEQGGRVSFHRGSFSELDPVLSARGIRAVDGILLDLGLNSWSLARAEKGLAYTVDGPLRMDVDPDLGRSAADLLRDADEEALARIFVEFGGVRRPRLYARRILQARSRHPITSTGALVRTLDGGRPGSTGADELSRIFQSLRVEVCREMERLERFLDRCPGWLTPGGRLAILTYASHEERRIKDRIRLGDGSSGPWMPLLRKSIRPGAEEVRRNRRARSAKLRVFEKGGASDVEHRDGNGA